ncbi:MAG: hypothetical protein ACOZE5_02750 [Verrucomicrobiota bacterium]|jgi:hypothetical protein
MATKRAKGSEGEGCGLFFAPLFVSRPAGTPLRLTPRQARGCSAALHNAISALSRSVRLGVKK